MALADMLNPLQQQGVAALRGGEQMLSALASSVHQAAEDYTAIDDHNALALHRAMEIR